MTLNSFGSRSALSVGGATYEIHRLDALSRAGPSLRSRAGSAGHVDWSFRLPESSSRRREWRRTSHPARGLRRSAR